MAKKKMWIADAINPKHKGSLRKELHVKKGEKIPEEKLEKAAHKPGKEGKRARLAETLKKMHHPKKKKKRVTAAPVGSNYAYIKTFGAKKAKKKRLKEEFSKFKSGDLHSGSKNGPVVTSRPQAIAIALHESGMSKKKKTKKKKK